MGEVVNLRLARKRKARAEADRLASENRVLHGRSLVQRKARRLEDAKASAFLEGHRREPPEPEPDGKA